MSGAVPAIDRLADALAAERRALLDHDADALLRATAAKLEALRAVEAQPVADEAQPRIRELAELNRANGALLARRRREVTWALRHLGRLDAAPAYNARGATSGGMQSRALAVA
ncbi:flagellar protein FlgN [Coralloluteibacterium stylophorae]|uniref:Flagellar protein FlgN n=1 Tax=Coralloluteibacterium stylophorae TaxID=1776034 RepID=A0A8J8AZ60_9GAMM|nr:flagellar protein FlgN [Coralloluteibacterium stylophorae]MBS7457190.1 flagellar protein FlgN [Coralloluteibacterium stylophorae]